MPDSLNRRNFVRIAAVTTGVGLAGCSSGSSTETEGDGGESTTSGGSDDGSGEGWTQTSTVEMTSELQFAPKRIEVEQGTTVTWETTGSIGHTVTAAEGELPDGAAYFASGGFDSEDAAVDGYQNGQEGNVPGGETYEHTFETKGEYEYYCIPHEMNGMVGYVKVI
ncbi:plastocyanin/azurin family copper-binding protein [Halorubellus sp. PRR65]|uniref:plastocyanin/azurin family copper-binding protein n=1 Tax=Halorubellus sp. PRR65 TaxID=3098148 RepID=UPI002B25E18E|nr:plastocyanin/azurin family copper-binding protein [Halorubellus sp. PRR65]